MTGLTFASWRAGPLEIEIDKANSIFGIYENFIVNFDKNFLVRYFGTERRVLIENRFCGIDAGCFRELADISTIDFEAGSRISSFGVGAFSACSELESISIPSTVETIPADCFAMCRKLRTVRFESVSRVSVLGHSAFSSCFSLTSICIPSSVTQIGVRCFWGCRCLANVTVDNGIRLSSIGEFAFAFCSLSLSLPTARTNHL
jgi:hypothetical protein